MLEFLRKILPKLRKKYYIEIDNNTIIDTTILKNNKEEINKSLKKSKVSNKIRKIILKELKTKEEEEKMKEYIVDNQKILNDHNIIQKLVEIKGYITPMSKQEKQEMIKIIMKD